MAAGQPLLVLESVQARAVFNALLHQHRTLLATQARLEAEQDGRAEMDLPAEFRDTSPHPDLARILEQQRAMLAVADVASTPADRVYQLWFIHDGKARSAGMFPVGATGTAQVALDGRMRAGDVVVFPNAGSYGYEFAMPAFLGHPPAVRRMLPARSTVRTDPAVAAVGIRLGSP